MPKPTQTPERIENAGKEAMAQAIRAGTDPHYAYAVAANFESQRVCQEIYQAAVSTNLQSPAGSDEGLRPVMVEVSDTLSYCRARRKPVGQKEILRLWHLVDEALSALSQAPVPTPSETVNFVQEVPGSAKFNDPVAQSAYEMGIRHGKALAQPVPTSGAVEVARQIILLADEKGECLTEAAAIIQQAMDGAVKREQVKEARFPEEPKPPFTLEIEHIGFYIQDTKERIILVFDWLDHDEGEKVGEAVVAALNQAALSTPPAADGKLREALDYQAELREARIEDYSDGEQSLIGRIYGDAKGRFEDGDWVKTSLIKSHQGDIYKTMNTTYKVSLAAQPASGGGE